MLDWHEKDGVMKMKIVVGAWLLTACFAGSASAACDALAQAAEATNAGNEALAREIAGRPKPGCTTDEKAMISRIVALASFNRIVGAVGQGANLADFEQELETIRKTNSAPWQVFDALGDINRDRRDYEAAARYYQLALEDASNEVLTPDWMAPDEKYIVRLDHMATEMRLAAPRPVKLAMRGACKISYRGVSLKKKSTPVRYVFGTAEFTPEGLESARDLSECLKSVKPKAITLIGHTDPVGTAQANRALSLERADALAQYLVTEGYAGVCTTVGKGEDEPFKADDASAYDEETLNQMNRRVEVDVEN
ncbi:OmpA family protein [Rhizobium herbae]|uniref:Outer membrane protein OmpA-like peptidoglycan-associated protein n=1 Tax=Rhizobium herbae TaxID=508661 RepID=A0ABS4EFE7_9HYPH|nr:OmpA family protein [Rhizobium herbae]MBP1856662.1 outer membrane protein OmpA-like peptidoglycan-associated protein [Rhizobium herbae]